MLTRPPDWSALERLRRLFLEGNGSLQDYWRAPSDLAAYDATFAQRIGWKWDFVLQGLVDSGWTPPVGELVDWGCGSGIAARAYLDRMGVDAVQGVRFVDRSILAMDFAAGRARERFPGLTVSTGGGTRDAVVLVSHVLTELKPSQVDDLVRSLQGAAAVLWVEPGTFAASRALLGVREAMRGAFHPIAPCLHTQACGILTSDQSGDWCHQFADPPPEVFADPFWTHFAQRLEIDLRSLPLSYLVLDRRPPPPRSPDAIRVLGRAEALKAEVRFVGCSACGVRRHHLTRREFPALWRDAKKGRFDSVQTPGSGSTEPEGI